MSLSSHSYEVLGLHVGQPKVVPFENQEVYTSIYKHSIEHKAFLSKTQLEGDAQADLKNHGGADKAICVYPGDHYEDWEIELGCRLGPGAFGENVTISGLTEERIHIGDIFQFGEAVVQVSQPKQPCYKLANKMGKPDLIQRIQTKGWSGYYLRVLKEGYVSKQDRFERIEGDSARITVSFVNRIRWVDRTNAEAIRTILKVDALSDAWRKPLTYQLEKYN